MIHCLNLHIREGGGMDSMHYGKFQVKIDADLNIISADLREYLFRSEDGSLVQRATNLICFEIWG